MDIKQLIDLAADSCGSKAALARAMGKKAPRISEWYRGEQKPDAHEIAYLAECAGLPILETVAEIESQLDERYAHIWREALGKMKAAGIAVSFAAVTFSGVLVHDNVNAATLGADARNQAMYIM